MHILAFVSGMPKALRDKSRLMVIQAWFDDSGKEGRPQSPVYLLAGYSAPVSLWASFADAWNIELNTEPKLTHLHTHDAYGLRNDFGKFKDGRVSPWLKYWGPRNWNERDKRLLRFADLIIDFLKNDAGESVTWMLKHEEYEQVFKLFTSHPLATPEELRMIKNPYFLSFQKVFGEMLKIHARKNRSETIHILFDCGIDRIDFLKRAFGDFIDVLKLESIVSPSSPPYLDLLENKEPEFRDDKKNPPLQAADLLAWHLRKVADEASHGREFKNKVWERLRSKELKHQDFRYEAADWARILNRMRSH